MGNPQMASAPAENRFEQHVMPHLDSVLRMAKRLTRDLAEAEDLVQDTYIRAFRAFDRFEMREIGVKPWLFRILHNTFFTERNRANRQPSGLDDAVFERLTDENRTADDSDVGVENIDWDGIDEELKRAVDKLLPEYRMVLLLWAFEDLSYKEIAEACECAVGTVMSRLFRARQLLAKELAQYAKTHNVPRKP